MTDPIADLLTRMRNAQIAGKSNVTVPHSNLKEQILNVFKKNGYVKNVAKRDDEKFTTLEIEFEQERPVLTVERISKPGQRIYKKHNEMKVIKNGLGIQVVSTSQGLMSNSEAYKQKLGGEIMCQVY